MSDHREDKPKSEFEERVVSIDRVSYTVAGGRRLRFRALVVVGNRQGKVGMGVAKAGEVAAAIQKAVTSAKKNLMTVPIIRETIPHRVEVRFGSAHVLLMPAPAGTSVIAGGSVRAVIELAGIKNIRSKALGSNSKINNVAATLEALKKLHFARVRPSASDTEIPAEVTTVEIIAPEDVTNVDATPTADTVDTKVSKPKATRPAKKVAKETA